MKKNRLLTMALTGALAALAPQWAMAGGTLSGTAIDNIATVNYKVGNVSQPLVESSPTGNSVTGVGGGAVTTFKVDDKVNFDIASNNAAFVTTYPGSSAVALKFTITNTGNTPHDFNLSNVVGAANTFVAGSITYYKDDGGTVGSFDATDTAITFLDELAVDTPTVVYLVAAVPITAANGDVASYALKATAHAAGAAGLGAITTANSGVADTAGSVDVVFADIDSDGAATGDDKGVDGTNSISSVTDGQYNGVYVMWAGGSPGSGDPGKGYQVAASVLTVTKTSAVYSDPINGTTNPKAIPGAVVTYTITIANAGGGEAATNVTIVDSLAAQSARMDFNTQFDDGTVAIPCVAGEGIVVDGICQTNVVGSPVDDQADFTANVVNVAASGSLAGGASKVIKYQVTIK
jgi:uncharacterized repeat protein (TIGR01451 family)